MKNKKSKILIIIMLFVVILATIFLIVKFPEYKKSRRVEMQKLNNSFDFFLFLSGDCEVSYNKVEPKRTTHLPTQLRVYISYYNFYNEEDVTYDMLMDEYYNFCDGKGEKHYENLMRYKDFMLDRFGVGFVEITPDNLDYNYVLDVCQMYLLKEYGFQRTTDEGYNELTQKQVDEVCNELFQQKDGMCDAVLNVGIKAHSKVPYDLMCVGISDSEMETNENGEKVLYIDDSAVCCYFKEGNINMLTDDKEWYVYKIELLKESNYNIFNARVGQDLEALKQSVNIVLPNVQLQEYGDKVMYQLNSIKFTAEFEDDACKKLTLELVDSEVITTGEPDSDTVKKEGIVQPSENAEEYFSGEVRITSYVEPDENGHYVVEESQWTLDEKRKSVDEEVELRKEEFTELGVEVIETSTDTDASASFVFDEENYYKMVAIIENVTNNRTGLYGQCVSISKDFDEVIMYVDENTELTDLVLRVSVLSFSVFQCQTYSGVKASDAHILLKVAHIETEEVLMELTLDMKTSFNISDEEWNALFEE